MAAPIITAKKHLWQNFLHNKDILNAIVDADDLSQKDIIEIGPGPWDLTERILSKSPWSLRVIEIDDDMIPLLQKRFWDKIEIYHHDVLTLNISKDSLEYPDTIHIPSEYHVYGNIPYYITSPILMHFLYGIDYPPVSLHITMQKEVADRILARDNKHTVLSLACQLVADVTKICDIHPNNFVPIPKVWSTCLRFDLKKWYNVDVHKKILTLIKQSFAQKRKKLSSNLTNAWHKKEDIERVFQQAWISTDIRAEDVLLKQWILLIWIL